MNICVVRKCNNFARKGFRKCIPCMQGIRPLDQIKEEEE